MSALRILALLALLAFTAELCSGQKSDCSYFGLLRHLDLAMKDPLLPISRPVLDWKTVTSVYVDVFLSGILQVDEKVQTVTSQIWVRTAWMNEFLAWNKEDFCGIDTVNVPTSQMWIPDVAIREDTSDTGTIFRGPYAIIFSSGYVFSVMRQRLTTTCQLDLWAFPFDVQKCEISFASMTFEAKALQLKAFSNGSVLTQYSVQSMVTLGEWKLKRLTIRPDNITGGAYTTSLLVYTATIERKPMLYVVNLIVPLLYLLALDLASFFIHEARGEKLGFKVTVLLSISVLLLILKDMLPSTEDSLPLIAIYCLVIFCLVGISVLEAMLVSFLIDLDGRRGGKDRRPAREEGQLELDRLKEFAGAAEKVQVEPDESDLPPDGPGPRDLMKQILDEVKAARREAEGQRGDGGGRYGRAARGIDAVFFVLYFIAVFTFLTYMYTVWIQDVSL